MKKTGCLWISWADRFGQPPKTIEQLTRDKYVSKRYWCGRDVSISSTKNEGENWKWK